MPWNCNEKYKIGPILDGVISRKKVNLTES